jgi:hypothetical protein
MGLEVTVRGTSQTIDPLICEQIDTRLYGHPSHDDRTTSSCEYHEVCTQVLETSKPLLKCAPLAGQELDPSVVARRLGISG